MRMAGEPTFCDKPHVSHPCSPWCPHGSGATQVPTVVEALKKWENNKTLMGKEIGIKERCRKQMTYKRKNMCIFKISRVYVYMCIYTYFLSLYGVFHRYQRFLPWANPMNTVTNRQNRSSKSKNDGFQSYPHQQQRFILTTVCLQSLSLISRHFQRQSKFQTATIYN